MYTLDYSFYAGLIRPGQLQAILNHAPSGCRIMPFSTISIPFGEGDPAALQEKARQLAGLLGEGSSRCMGAVDISSLLMESDHAGHWEAYARRLGGLSSPVCYPCYEIKKGGERVFSSDKDPEARFSSLHKRNRICLETPPHHEFGLYSCDLGFVVPKDGRAGDCVHLFAGGGGGIYGGSPALAPRPASWLGLYSCDEALAAAAHLMELNEKWGNPDHPRRRRLKSLFAEQGEDWILSRLGEAGFHVRNGLAPAFISSGEWSGDDSRNDRLVAIPSGRLEDSRGYPLASFLKRLLPMLTRPLRLTPHGNLRIHQADAAAIPDIKSFLADSAACSSPLKVGALACRGAPLCRRGKARSSLILGELDDLLDGLLCECGLEREDLVFRISGCPNGCSRPLFAELALIGRTEHTYDLFAGGSPRGDRVALILQKAIRLEELPGLLKPLLREFSEARKSRVGLSFGDWIFPALKSIS